MPEQTVRGCRCKASDAAVIFQLSQNLYVRGTEIVKGDLLSPYPADVVMLKLTRYTLRDFRVKEGEVNADVGISVFNLREYAAHGDSDAKLFAALAHQSLLLRLARFHLAADKLPEQAARLLRWTLADHEFIIVPNQRRYNFRHLHPVPSVSFYTAHIIGVFAKGVDGD